MEISFKESLNSDGQQFHQYQQNLLPSLTSNHWIQKIPLHVALEIQVLTWDRNKHMTARQSIIS